MDGWHMPFCPFSPNRAHNNETKCSCDRCRAHICCRQIDPAPVCSHAHDRRPSNNDIDQQVQMMLAPENKCNREGYIFIKYDWMLITRSIKVLCYKSNIQHARFKVVLSILKTNNQVYKLYIRRLRARWYRFTSECIIYWIYFADLNIH